VTVEVDVEIRERSNLAAVNGVFRAAGDDLSSTDGGGDLLDDGGGSGEGGGTGVGDEAGVGDEDGAAQREGVELTFPVSFVGEGNGDEVASVVIRVGTTEVEFTVEAALFGEVEGEFGLEGRVLGEEVLEDGGSAGDGDGGPSETEDTVELANQEGGTETSGVGDLSEALVGGRKAANVNGILAHIARNGTGTVQDVEGGVVLDVSSGSILVIALVQEARGDGTGLRREP